MHTATRQLAVRSYLTAGVAAVGASVIAVSPVAPPLPHIQLPSVHEIGVALSAATDPFAAYQDVFNAANTNLQAILSTALENGPTPILTQVLTNQITGFQDILKSLPTSADSLTSALTGAAAADPSSSLATLLNSDSTALQTLVTALQTAFGQINTALTTTVPPLLQGAFTDLTQANVEGAVNNVLLAAIAPLYPLTGVLGPALGVISAPLQSVVTAIDSLGPVATVLANPLQNVVNVLNVPTTQNLFFTLGAAGLIGPLVEAPASVATAAQGVIDAIKSGDPASVLTAAADAPAVIAGGLLNGGLGPDIGDLVAPSLGLPTGFFTVHFGGLLSGLLNGNPDGTITSSGLIAGLQEIQSLVAGALTPPKITTATDSTLKIAADTKTAADTTATTTTAKPSALPSLKSIGIKLPHVALTPAKAADTSATDATATATTGTAATGTTKKPDTTKSDTSAATKSDSDGSAASSDKSDSGAKSDAGKSDSGKSGSGKSQGRHRAHDSSSSSKGDSGSKGGSGGGRHHAA